MDNLTHSLVGALLSRAGLNRLSPVSMPVLLLAANAPDIDVAAGAGGTAQLIHIHRGLTHSLAFSPVLALCAVFVVWPFVRRRGSFLRALAVALAGVLSHLLLDLTNNYGTRIYLPFSGRWASWDTTYVIDPYIWGALLIALIAPLLGRLLSSEMGMRKTGYPPRGWAVAGLLFVLIWDCGRTVLHARAISILNARVYDGASPTRVAAFPTPLNPLAWEGLVELPDRYYLFNVSLAEEFRPGSGRLLYRNDPGDAPKSLARDRSFQTLIEFARYPLWRVIEDAGRTHYRLTDLRFGDPARQTFTCAGDISGGTSVRDVRCDWTFSGSWTN